MRNSALLRRFLICLAFPLTFISASTLRPRQGALVPAGKTATAEVAQVRDHSVQVWEFSCNQLIPRRKRQGPEHFKELMEGRSYSTIMKIGASMGNDEFLDHLRPLMTTVEHFKGLFGYLKRRGMVPTFLAHEEIVLVKDIIVEADLLETNYCGQCDTLCDAISVSLQENRHDRVLNLFRIAYEKPVRKKDFGLFVYGFFSRHYSSGKNDMMSLKRFLTFHGQKFKSKYPAIFETVCAMFVCMLSCNLGLPDAQKLLTDFVAQPSLLTPTAFAEAFFGWADTSQVDFIKYGWREALEEALKEEYYGGGKKLWRVLVNEFPGRFPEEYPNTDQARKDALMGSKPTKQDMEEGWIEENRQKLEEHFTELLPPVLSRVIIEYVEVGWIIA